MGGCVDRTERFYKIEMMIRSISSITFNESLAAVEVSRATLKRDLLYLRSRMDAPTVCDRFDNSGAARLAFVNETELVMDVLRHGGQVSVQSPASLVESVNAQLRAALVANAAAQ